MAQRPSSENLHKQRLKQKETRSITNLHEHIHLVPVSTERNTGIKPSTAPQQLDGLPGNEYDKTHSC